MNSDLVNAAINFWIGQPDPIDWESKARADEQRLKKIMAEEKRDKNGSDINSSTASGAYGSE